jgi:hypothetical protein
MSCSSSVGCAGGVAGELGRWAAKLSQAEAISHNRKRSRFGSHPKGETDGSFTGYHSDYSHRIVVDQWFVGRKSARFMVPTETGQASDDQLEFDRSGSIALLSLCLCPNCLRASRLCRRRDVFHQRHPIVIFLRVDQDTAPSMGTR